MPNMRSAKRTCANGNARAERAAQFMPFAALTGYYELVREQERVAEPRREMTDETAAALTTKLARIRRGDLVRVTFYDLDGYINRVDVVEQIETPFRRLRLKGLTIPFDDILDIELKGRE